MVNVVSFSAQSGQLNGVMVVDGGKKYADNLAVGRKQIPAKCKHKHPTIGYSESSLCTAKFTFTEVLLIIEVRLECSISVKSLLWTPTQIASGSCKTFPFRNANPSARVEQISLTFRFRSKLSDSDSRLSESEHRAFRRIFRRVLKFATNKN